jgi:type IV secretory pathway TrbD component
MDEEIIFNIMFGLVGLMIPLFGLAAFGLWIWMLVDCLQSKMAENEKLLWVIILLLGNFIGAILYFFLVKNKKTK